MIKILNYKLIESRSITQRKNIWIIFGTCWLSNPYKINLDFYKILLIWKYFEYIHVYSECKNISSALLAIKLSRTKQIFVSNTVIFLRFNITSYRPTKWTHRLLILLRYWKWQVSTYLPADCACSPGTSGITQVQLEATVTQHCAVQFQLGTNHSRWHSRLQKFVLNTLYFVKNTIVKKDKT